MIVSLGAAPIVRWNLFPWGSTNTAQTETWVRFFTGQIKNEGKTVSHWAAKKIGMPFSMIWLKLKDETVFHGVMQIDMWTFLMRRLKQKGVARVPWCGPNRKLKTFTESPWHSTTPLFSLKLFQLKSSSSMDSLSAETEIQTSWINKYVNNKKKTFVWWVAPDEHNFHTN